jgi:hypothetical protein
MSWIQVALDERIARLLGDSTEQIERSAIEMIVLGLYRQHEISAGRAAELLGLDELDFVRWAGSLGIPYFDTTPQDWERQLRVIDKE